MKVLVVDGNRNITQVLSSLLGLFGHAADEASEGREALRKLQLVHCPINNFTIGFSRDRVKKTRSRRTLWPDAHFRISR